MSTTNDTEKANTLKQEESSHDGTAMTTALRTSGGSSVDVSEASSAVADATKSIHDLGEGVQPQPSQELNEDLDKEDLHQEETAPRVQLQAMQRRSIHELEAQLEPPKETVVSVKQDEKDKNALLLSTQGMIGAFAVGPGDDEELVPVVPKLNAETVLNSQEAAYKNGNANSGTFTSIPNASVNQQLRESEQHISKKTSLMPGGASPYIQGMMQQQDKDPADEDSDVEKNLVDESTGTALLYQDQSGRQPVTARMVDESELDNTSGETPDNFVPETIEGQVVKKSPSSGKRWIVVAVIVVIVIIALSVSLTKRKTSSNDLVGTPREPAPTPEPGPMFCEESMDGEVLSSNAVEKNDTILEIKKQIAEILLPFSGQTLYECDSPQRQALEWLIQEDGQRNMDSQDGQDAIARYLLMVFYFSSGGRFWKAQHNFGDTERHVCEWATTGSNTNAGVGCNAVEKVVSIRLQGNDLVGSLPSELFFLTDLQVITLGRNGLVGSLYSEIGRLSELSDLHLNHNDLTGPLPESLGTLTGLRQLHVQHNGFEGTIPASIFDYKNDEDSLTLERFRVENNQLTGPIPDHVGNAHALQYFRIEDNFMNGTIPSSVDNFTDVVRFDVEDNSFSGTLPSLAQSTKLVYLLVSGSGITGTIPESWANLTTLRGMALRKTSVTGSYQHIVQDWNRLELIWINNNPNMWGQFPVFSSEKLIELRLQRNGLTGNLDDMVRLPNATLERFDFQDNDFTGTIPTEIGYFSNLVYFSVAENSLKGTIPSQVGLMTNLKTRLFLWQNELTGTIPSDVGNLVKLTGLYMGENQIMGTLPSELGNLVDMKFFSVAYNQLIGTLPPEITNWTKIQFFNMSGNFITGDVSPQLCEQQPPPSTLVTDCYMGSITCDCCTLCCDPNATCVDPSNTTAL